VTARASVDDDAVRTAVRAVRRGDRDQFGPIVAAFERRLFGLMLMMTRDRAAAEDVTQETFVRAFQHLDRFDDARPFYPWLSTIAVRLAQNWLVQRVRIREREGAEIDAEASTAAIADDDPLTELITDERERSLWRAVASLPSGERTAVVLHYRQEMSVSEIARALGVTDGTVKTLLFRARKRLRAVEWLVGKDESA
jgi:RNA polymerase sigma-70 factor (ECF subfamily)